MSSLMRLMAGLSISGPKVSANTTSPLAEEVINDQCFAGTEFNSDGVENRRDKDDGTHPGVTRGTWLDSGLNSEVWVERTINSGTLDNDSGAGRLVMSTSRQFGVNRQTEGTGSANLTIDFWDAASGGNNLKSYTLIIEAKVTIE